MLFLEPDHRSDHWLNRLSASIGRRLHGRGFCHVELSMPSLDRSRVGQHGGYVSTSIYNGETVRVVSTKTFANPGYVVHTLSVGRDQLQRITDFAHESQRRGVGFDALGMYLATLPFQLKPASQRHTFCSRYVVEALQDAGGIPGVEGLNASTTSPSKLYRSLAQATAPGGEQQQQQFSSQGGPRQVPGVVGTVSFKLEQLKRHGSVGGVGYSLMADQR